MAEITLFQCGPSSPTCHCECDKWEEGKPKPRCDHVWDGKVEEGPLYAGRGWYSTTTCSRCGMTSMAHDEWLF